MLSTTCYCGNSYGSHGVSADCNVTCNGNPNEICGGVLANSIYLSSCFPSDEGNYFQIKYFINCS